MPQLYLASLNLNKLPDLLVQSPSETKLAFISTAADPYQDKWFVEEDRQKLRQQGFQIKELTLVGKNPQQLEAELRDIQVIYVAGGNAFYLMQKVYESGFDQVLKKLLDKGVIYAGGSAGAVIAGSHLEPLKTLDDPKAAPSLKEYRGLNLVPVVILPHYGREKYLSRYEAVIKEYESKYPLQPLKDSQVIVMNGEDWQIVEVE